MIIRKKIKKISFFDLVYLMIGSVWLFFVLLTSGEYTQFKTVLLGVITFISFLEIVVHKKRIPKKLFKYVFIFVTYFILTLFLGIFLKYEFSITKDFSLIQYYMITPILILILYMIFYKNEKRLNVLIKIITYITLILLFLNIGCFLSLHNMIPELPVFEFVNVNTDSIAYGKIAFRINNESSLMFLLPFYIVMLFENSDSYTSKKNLIYIIVILGTIYTLLSGRKILEIVVALTYILMFIRTSSTINKKNITKFIIMIMLFCLIFFLLNSISSNMGVDNIFEKIFETISNGLSSKADGVIKRKNNLTALLDLWLKSPLFGNGLNSYAYNSLASSITKWSYEIVYVALLAQTGIVGIGIFFFGVYYILKKLYVNYKIKKNNIYFATFIGFASFIICGASNPLVYFIWPWLISLTICETK